MSFMQRCMDREILSKKSSAWPGFGGIPVLRNRQPVIVRHTHDRRMVPLMGIRSEFGMTARHGWLVAWHRDNQTEVRAGRGQDANMSCLPVSTRR